MRSWPAALWILLTTLLSGCPSQVLLSIADQEKIQARNEKKTFFLKQSFFVGPFYAYDDKLFISERAFDERVLLESAGGDPILPPSPTGILPMGTKVTIRQIEFPTGSVFAGRKLHSPRHFTWVLLDRADQPEEKPFVLVLTPEFKKIEEFEKSLEAYLIKEDPRPAFAKNAEELEAIDKKAVIKDMSANALLRSRGYPDRITREFDKATGAKLERWQYASERSVNLREDRVESWSGFGADGERGPE